MKFLFFIKKFSERQSLAITSTTGYILWHLFEKTNRHLQQCLHCLRCRFLTLNNDVEIGTRCSAEFISPYLYCHRMSFVQSFCWSSFDTRPRFAFVFFPPLLQSFVADVQDQFFIYLVLKFLLPNEMQLNIVSDNRRMSANPLFLNPLLLWWNSLICVSCTDKMA